VGGCSDCSDVELKKENSKHFSCFAFLKFSGSTNSNPTPKNNNTT